MSKRNPSKYPDHINPEKLPEHVGYDPRGNGLWYYRKRKGNDRGKQYRLGNKKLTLAKIYKAVERIEKEKDTLRSISQAFQKSIDWQDLAKSTQSDYLKCHSSICERETRHGNKLGDLPLESWTPVAVRKFKDVRAKESRSRARKEIAYLKRLFKWSIGYGYMRSNPAKDIETKKLIKARSHYVKDDDYLAALIIAPMNISVMMHLAYLTGRRRNDIVDLHKGHNIQSNGIHFTESKTEKITIVLWSKELRETVKLAKELSGDSDWLFPARDQRHHYSLSALDTAWQKLSIKLSKAGFNRFQFKDIRAKYATDLVSKGGNATKNLQHSNCSVTKQHYLRKPLRIPSLR